MLHSRSSDRLHGGFGASPSDLPGQTTVATARRRPAEWLLGTVCVLTQGSRALAGGFAGANDPISDNLFHKLLTAPDVSFCAKQFDFPADTIMNW